MRFSVCPEAMCLRLVFRNAGAPWWLAGVLLIVLLAASGYAAPADQDGEDDHPPRTDAGTYSMKRDVEGETSLTSSFLSV